MDAIVEQFKKLGILPVVVLDDAKYAESLADVLFQGGLPCAEITFRTSAAEESIKLISSKHPEILVGAGTVLTKEQVDRAVDAGAKFIVSPGFDEEVIRYCQKKGTPVFPGTMTPTEMMKAIAVGLKVVKFFPAESAGGIKMIKSCAAPFTNLSFMPTGGIGVGNVKDYLLYDKIVCCGGSWMVPKDLVNEGKFDEIEKKVREAAKIVKDIRG